MNERGKPESVDELTGLYRKKDFFCKAEYMLTACPEQAFDVMAIDIEHFKLFNDWYGFEEGNRLLQDIGCVLKAQEHTCRSVAGYMGGDDFVILMEREEERLQQLQSAVTGFSQRQDGDSGFLPAFGVYHVEEPETDISVMYDCATIALQSVKGNYIRRVSVYDPEMKRRMDERQRLLREVKSALQNEELSFYLQPVYNMNNEKIVGMESLLRWIHPERGVIPPGDFLPVLEENGFITKVDLYVWERVCSRLHQWIVNGHQPIPVSVNVSRMDIYALDLPQVFKELAEQYQIPSSLLEIEITESAYMQDYDLISEVTDKLRSYGFPVFMDDFGSGYSSLNMLKNVKTDVLKIDTKFLVMTPDSMEHGVDILEAVVNMANLMNMKLIAEGVETAEQVQFLKDMGCTYAQGYYYSRPMPIEEMERVIASEACLDLRGIEARQINRFSLGELYNKNVVNETMLNHMMGGVAFYDVYQDRIELVRVNEQYFLETGTGVSDLEEHKKYMIESIVDEDRSRFEAAFKNARENRNRGAVLSFRYEDAPDSIRWIHMRLFFLREQDGHRLYYASVQNITGQKQQEEALKASQNSLKTILGLSGYNESFLNMTVENRTTATTIFSQMVPCGMVGGYCEDGFPLYFANEEMVRLLGYESYEEMVAGIDGKIINTIYEEDRESVARAMGTTYYCGMEYVVKYRTVCKDGSLFWTMDKGKVVEAEDGRLAIVSACIDISDSMEVQEQLEALNHRLQEQNMELGYLTNDQPGGYHRCADTADFEFLFISNRFLEMFGYEREEIRELFDDKFGRMIHPDDMEGLKKQLDGSKVGDIYNLEYRMLSSSGYIWVADQTKKMEFNGSLFYYGVILDITSTVEMKEQLEMAARQDRSIVENLLEKTTYSFKANLTKDRLVMDESGMKWLRDNGHEGNTIYSSVVADSIHQVVVPENKQKLAAFLDREQLIDNFNAGIESQAYEYCRIYQGEPCWMQAIYHLMELDHTGDIYIYFYTVNINDQKKQELELKKRAEYDELTGLYNRQTAIPMMERCLLEDQGHPSAIIMFDLDNFKRINDKLGHVCGDEALSAMARCLQGYFRKEDILCRIGGDEFMVLCRGIEEADLCRRLDVIMDRMYYEHASEQECITCSISAGYVMAPEHGTDFHTLYRKADEALLEAKQAGKRIYKAYSSTTPELV